jgi:hypothetical protein
MLEGAANPRLLTTRCYHDPCEFTKETTLEDIAEYLERLGFTAEHVVELTEQSWFLEHPISCRLRCLGEDGVMRSLMDVCDIHQLLRDGGDELLWHLKGLGRYQLDDQVFRDLVQCAKESPSA